MSCVTCKTFKDERQNNLVHLDFYKEADDALRTGLPTGAKSAELSEN